jgi:hypothetical protein
MAVINPVRVLTATIANAASLSDAVPVNGQDVVGIVTPAAMTGGGNITFQGSHDGVTFNNIFTTSAELSIGAIAASQYYALSPDLLKGLVAIKVRTGTAGAPIVQAAQRLISVVVKG